MSEETIKASGDLIRWLKMLALPVWAKWLLALMMVLVLGSALSLLVCGGASNHIEVVSSAVAILTVGLPIGLIVVALVFGDGGAHNEDFLLNPGERLYFAQDLAFFIRGLLSVELQHD